MGGIAVIGEHVRVQGFGLAGALVMVAAEPAAVRRCWQALPGEVDVVVLTPAAADAIGDPAGRLTVVMPP